MGCQQGMPAVVGLDGRVRHGNAHNVRRNTWRQLGRLIQLAEEDCLALRMTQHIVDAFRRLQRIQRHADQPSEHDCQVSDDPLGAVLRQERYPISRHTAQRMQGCGHTPCLVIHLGPGEVMPLAVYRLAEPDRIGAFFNPERQALQGQLIGHRNPSFLLLYRHER